MKDIAKFGRDDGNHKKEIEKLKNALERYQKEIPRRVKKSQP